MLANYMEMNDEQGISRLKNSLEVMTKKYFEMKVSISQD
jgi:hypothetical protein